jgi:predicted DNA-binding transcriptional regulator YafY
MARKLIIDGDHLARLIKLCRVLATAEGLSLSQIQSKLKASRRTVFRGFGSLQALGIKVELSDGRYRTRQNVVACRKIIADTHTTALVRLLNTSLR